MTRHTEAQEHLPQQELAYPARVRYLLVASVYSGFKTLRSTGWPINYEQLCQEARHIAGGFEVEGWQKYWQTWEEEFRQSSKKGRDRVFSRLIESLYNHNLMPENIHGLSGNISQRIQDILEAGDEK